CLRTGGRTGAAGADPLGRPDRGAGVGRLHLSSHWCGPEGSRPQDAPLHIRRDSHRTLSQEEPEMKSDVVVDADSHVEEPQETWEDLAGKYADRRPVPVTGDPAFFKYGANSLWFIDGNIFPKITAARGVTVYATPVTMEWAKRKSFSVPSQTLLDPDARL